MFGGASLVIEKTWYIRGQIAECVIFSDVDAVLGNDVENA